MLVLAHRGADEGRRENTVEAFLEARRLGSDGVELDVRLSADGAAVVHHDAQVEGLGRISELTVPELPEWLPLLEEALDACAGMLADVEVKNLPGEPDWDQSESLANLVASQLSGAGRHEAALVSSFSIQSLEAVRDVDPGIATGWLTLEGLEVPTAVELACAAGCSALHPVDSSVTEELVRTAQGAGLEVVVWTVDDPARIRQLASMGADAVITNRPAAALAALGHRA